MAEYDNTSGWGKATAQERYGSGTLQPKSGPERAFGSPKTTRMPPKIPSDSYRPPSDEDRGVLGEMAKKHGGRS